MAIKHHKPRIAFFDIETSFGLFYTFANNMYEASLAKEHTPIKLLCVSVKELGKKPKNYALIDYPTYKEFVSAVREEVFLKYDILVAHNGKKFDLRMCNTFFAEVGLPKVDRFPRNLIDTKNESKREFNLPSYSLKYILSHYNLGAKIETGGEQLWFDCMAFNPDGTPQFPKRWKEMIRYCNGDVVGGEALYLFLENGKWIKWPSHLVFYTPGEGCIECGIKDLDNFQSRGKEIPRRDGLVDGYMCKNCGKRNYTFPISRKKYELA